MLLPRAEPPAAGTPLQPPVAGVELPLVPNAPATPITAPEDGVRARPLHTYRGDVEETIRRQGTSVISIASAEARRREQESAPAPTERKSSRRIIMLCSVLLLGAATLLGYSFVATEPSPEGAVLPASFIAVDEADELELSEETDRTLLMQQLSTERDATALSLGLMRQIYMTKVSAPETRALLSAREFLSLLTSRAPDELLRNLDPEFMFGVHVFDGNQPLLLLKTPLYEAAFRGMLAWEEYMVEDLYPLFARTPRPNTPGEGTVKAPLAFLKGPFTDRIVENRDVRAVTDARGEILFLWTFLSRELILITTNESTVREVVSRSRGTAVSPLR